jgi:hypothetical protein
MLAECIAVLLEHGAIIDRKAGRKYSSLAEAVSVGDKDTIRTLLKKSVISLSISVVGAATVRVCVF